MTNFEWLVSQTDPERLGKMLCHMIDYELNDCEMCPCTRLCRKGHNGIVAWLKEERTDLVKFLEERGLE